jgi:hypothetical protein
MTSIKKLIVVAALALTALAATAVSANAATGVSISPAGEISQTSIGKVTFTAGESRIECNLTLAGRLSSTLVSITSSIGSVTRVTWANCVGGEVSAVLGLPWSITITKLNGTTPSRVAAEAVTSGQIKIAGTAFKLSVFGGFVECLYGGSTSSVEASMPATKVSGTTRSYNLGNLTIQANSLALTSGGFGCPGSGSMSGTFNPASPTQTTTFL